MEPLQVALWVRAVWGSSRERAGCNQVAARRDRVALVAPVLEGLRPPAAQTVGVAVGPAGSLRLEVPKAREAAQRCRTARDSLR